MISPQPSHRSNYSGSDSSPSDNTPLKFSRQQRNASTSSMPSLNNPQKLPSYTEIHTTSPMAAGLPILEIVKKLEEEKVISREDRAILKEALYSTDPIRRDEMIKALCDVELSSYSRFALRRLKSVIHQNGGGEVSSKNMPDHHKLQQVGNQSGSSSGTKAVPQKLFSSHDKEGRQAKVPSRHHSSEEYGNNDSTPPPLVHQRSQNQQISQSIPPHPATAGVAVKPTHVNQGGSSNSATSASLRAQQQQAQQPTRSSSSHMDTKSLGRAQPSIGSLSLSPGNNAGESSSIHSNGQNISKAKRKTGGEVSVAGPGIGVTSSIGQYDEEESEQMFNIQSTVSQVVGEMPVYSGVDNFNVLAKIMQRYNDLRSKVDPNKLRTRKLVVLVGSGSYNPLTRMHLRTYFLAKQYLESHLGCLVLGSLLSPAHPVTVRERYRTNPSEVIPAPHRLAVAQLLVQNSQWLSIDPWEMTRRRAMDYLSVLERVQRLLSDAFPSMYSIQEESGSTTDFGQNSPHGGDMPEIKVMYLCKANLVPKLSAQALKAGNFSVITVCRTPESDNLRNSLTGKWNNLIHIVEDTAILDASFDMVTSRKVRDKVKAGESVETLVGGKINEYCLLHRLGPKMNGLEEWTAEERQLPKIASRPAEPTLRSQQLASSSQFSVISTNTNNSRKVVNNANSNTLQLIVNSTTKTIVLPTQESRSNKTNQLPQYLPSWSSEQQQLLLQQQQAHNQNSAQQSAQQPVMPSYKVL